MSNNIQPTEIQIERWRSTLDSIRDTAKESTVAAFRIAIEYSIRDDEFYDYWKSRAVTFSEPIKGNLLLILSKIKDNEFYYDFDTEFTRMFTNNKGKTL